MTTRYVTNRQIGFILLLTIIDFSFMSVPKIAFETAGTGAWFSLFLTALMLSIFAFIITNLSYNNRDMTLLQYCPNIVGNVISKVINIIYAIYYLIAFILIARAVTEFVSVDILIKTPTWAILIVLICSTGYAASKGLTNLGRLLELFGLELLIAATLIHSLMFFSGDKLNIMPFYNTSETKRYLMAIKDLVVPLNGIEILILIPLGSINGKKVRWLIPLFILLVGFFYIVIAETSAMIIGSSDIVNYWNALLVAIRRTEVPFIEFLKRLDIVFLNIGVMGIFGSVSIHYYAAIESISNVFNKVDRRIIIIIVGIVSIITGSFLKGFSYISHLYSLLIMYSVYITAFLIPLILLIVMKVKMRVK